ncbi:MAG: TVP38/TMEM64 family protein [Deltaproteobacteria bacterium]|nr:TVP38/TMEM64 family protein [Deltaproteobacteria bacterium]
MAPIDPEDPGAEAPQQAEILPPSRPHLGGPPSGRTFDPDGRTIDSGPRRSRSGGGSASSNVGCSAGCAPGLFRLVAIGVALFGAGALFLALKPAGGPTEIARWLHDAGPAGMAVVVAGVALSTPLFVPSGILAIIPGYVWGTALGTGLTVLGAALGGAINILLARRLLGDWVGRMVAGNPMLAALRQSIATRGFRIALGLRLSPVAPYALLAYLAGIAGLRVRVFALASILGGIPWTSVYAAFGALLATQRKVVALDAPPESPGMTALRVAGVLFTIGIAWWIGRVARRDLDRIRRGG